LEDPEGRRRSKWPTCRWEDNAEINLKGITLLIYKDRNFLILQAVEELKQVFTAELAHMTYVPFFRFLGESVMDTSLKNHDFIRDLCCEYEQEMQSAHLTGGPIDLLCLSDYLHLGEQRDPDKATGSGSFGSNVAVVGNRIDLQQTEVSSIQLLPSGSPNVQAPGADAMALIRRKMENTNR
jgi:hypothetical protein